MEAVPRFPKTLQVKSEFSLLKIFGNPILSLAARRCFGEMRSVSFQNGTTPCPTEIGLSTFYARSTARLDTLMKSSECTGFIERGYGRGSTLFKSWKG